MINIEQTGCNTGNAPLHYALNLYTNPIAINVLNNFSTRWWHTQYFMKYKIFVLCMYLKWNSVDD